MPGAWFPGGAACALSLIHISNYMNSRNLCLEEFCQAKEEAEEEYFSRGGDLEAALAAEKLPEGPVILLEEGPDGDREITIFHD